MLTTDFTINDIHAKTWNLYPVGDLQFGADGFREDLYTELVYDITHDPNALTIGTGDYSDMFRPTIQADLKRATAQDSSAEEQLEDLHKMHIEKVANKLKHVIKKGRCLGLLGGHHDMDYNTGMTSTQYLCNSLGVKYLGRSCLMRLIFSGRKAPHQSATAISLKIHAQHGDGGASFVSTDLGNLERKTMPYYNADIYIRGHSTKKGIIETLEYDLDWSKPPKCIEKKKLLVNTGGFMSGYLNGVKSNYVERKNMAPSSLGWVVIHIRIYNCGKNDGGHRQLLYNATMR